MEERSRNRTSFGKPVKSERRFWRKSEKRSEFGIRSYDDEKVKKRILNIWSKQVYNQTIYPGRFKGTNKLQAILTFLTLKSLSIAVWRIRPLSPSDGEEANERKTRSRCRSVYETVYTACKTVVVYQASNKGAWSTCCDFKANALEALLSVLAFEV